MKIILLGYMGSGKSTIGKLLSERLNLNFIDLDSYIEAQEKKSVKEIFAQKGEIFFRKIESKYLSTLLSNSEDYVLSLGGGTPCFGNNMDRIVKSKTISFFLRCRPSTLSERLAKEKAKRPIINHLKDENLTEFISKHLFERNPYYEKATYQIQTDKKTADEIVCIIEKHNIN